MCATNVAGQRPPRRTCLKASRANKCFRRESPFLAPYKAIWKMNNLDINLLFSFGDCALKIRNGSFESRRLRKIDTRELLWVLHGFMIHEGLRSRFNHSQRYRRCRSQRSTFPAPLWSPKHLFSRTSVLAESVPATSCYFRKIKLQVELRLASAIKPKAGMHNHESASILGKVRMFDSESRRLCTRKRYY